MATAYIWFFMDILIVYRRMKEVLIGNVVSFAAVFPLSWWLIEWCGANGVSFAGAIAYAIGALLLVYFTFRAVSKGRG